MSVQARLYRNAKRVLARDPSLTDEQLAQACGIPRHVIAGWTPGTPERMTIREVRREVERDRADQQAAMQAEQRLRAASMR